MSDLLDRVERAIDDRLSVDAGGPSASACANIVGLRDATKVAIRDLLAEMRAANKAHYTGDDTEVEEFLRWFAARHGLADG